jgi:predicted nucleic acid-binding protein
VIAIDTNLLVFAHFRNAVLHREALRALEPIVEGSSPWALPWPCVHEFISVVTNSRIYKLASTLSEAFGFIESLLESPQLQALSESPGYFEKLRNWRRLRKFWDQRFMMPGSLPCACIME